MIDCATRSPKDAAAEAAPEILGRYCLLADNHEIHETVAGVISNGIGSNVCDSNSHGNWLTFQVLLAWVEHADFDLAGCLNRQKQNRRKEHPLHHYSP